MTLLLKGKVNKYGKTKILVHYLQAKKTKMYKVT